MELKTVYNKVQKFLHINQWDKTLTRRACSQYRAYINYRYNIWADKRVKDSNESWMEAWVKESINSKLLWVRSGWSLADNNEFVRKRIWANCLKLRKDIPEDMKQLKELYNNGYMIWIWVKYWHEFIEDRTDDWIINRYKDFIHYANDKITVRHGTNIIRRDGKHLIYDNYRDRNQDGNPNNDNNLYEISDFDEFIEHICYRTFYCFV